MLAAVYHQPGPSRAVLRIAELPDPVPKAGEVRVRLQWSGVNPSDVKARAGLRSPMHEAAFTVPHSDGMGVIDRVGSGVDPGRLGERVWIWNGAFNRQFGTAAQYITLPSDQAVLLPGNVRGSAGACLGIPALTAMHAVLNSGGMRDKALLVTGGAGAVGNYAVQFAKLLGARLVIATVSTEAKAALAKEAGADLVLNYRDDDIANTVLSVTNGDGVDRIVDVDLATNAATSVKCTALGGDWLVYGSSTREVQLPFFPMISQGIAVRFFVVYRLNADARRSAVAHLTRLLEEGQVVHNVARQLDLEDIALAHELVEQGAVAGKVVLRIGQGGHGDEEG